MPDDQKATALSLGFEPEPLAAADSSTTRANILRPGVSIYRLLQDAADRLYMCNHHRSYSHARTGAHAAAQEQHKRATSEAVGGGRRAAPTAG